MLLAWSSSPLYLHLQDIDLKLFSFGESLLLCTPQKLLAIPTTHSQGLKNTQAHKLQEARWRCKAVNAGKLEQTLL